MTIRSHRHFRQVGFLSKAGHRCLCWLLFIATSLHPQIAQATHPAVKDRFYLNTFEEITAMLDGKAELSVKRAVFLLEWAYLQGEADYTAYCRDIAQISDNLKGFIQLNGLNKHPIGGNMALFEFFTNPNPLNGYIAYEYDFEDYMGREDFTRTFVTKLMRTHSGQCRTLPLFYKILANEIGTQAYIAYAPNHSFIRHRSEDGSKWINVELTNHSTPRDIFIIETSGITERAIEKGIYMKSCDDKQIVIELLVELTYGYERLYGMDGFIEQCVKTVLQYDPDNLAAWMRRADRLYCEGTAYQRELHRRGLSEDQWSLDNYSQYKAAEQKLADLGYTQMPRHLYDNWIKSVQSEIQRRETNKQ